METQKDDLLNDFKDSKNHKSKPLITAFVTVILFIFVFIIMIVLIILQSRKINDLTNQINKLTNQFDKQSILSNQSITNLNWSLSDKIDNLQKALKLKEEEIKLLKHDSNNLNNERSLIYNGINDIKNELEQNSKEIELLKNDSNNLNNEKSLIYNDISDIKKEIISLKNLESNLAILVNFKIRIKADFYINQKQAQLCSHKNIIHDIIDDSRIRLNVFQDGYDGCVWIVHQNGKFFEFTLTDSNYGMNNWKIEIKNNNAYCTNKEKGSIFILEAGSLYKYYKIKNKETGQYLFVNSNKKRDSWTYYIDLTLSEEMATDFYFEIYHE